MNILPNIMRRKLRIMFNPNIRQSRRSIVVDDICTSSGHFENAFTTTMNVLGNVQRN